MNMDAPQNNAIEQELLDMDVRLRCPRCGAGIDGLDCPACYFRIRTIDGILHALPEESAAHYVEFVRDYERIREAEGRGSESDDFYLNLPFRDISKNNSAQWRIRVRSYDYIVRHLLSGSKTILDLGAGNCWMSYRLALAGYRPVAVDLLTNDRDGLGAARHYQGHLPKRFPRIQAEIVHLPFEDEQFDAAIFNASFHYAEDYEASLREALRCLRGGGAVIVSDTPWYPDEGSGRKMVDERRAAFLKNYGTASNSLASLDYLTPERLRVLEEKLSIHWETHCPRYGLRWAMRPLMAKLRGRRKPSLFRIYVARKIA